MANLFVVLLLAAALALSGQAEAQFVWQLGKFDQSPVEFSSQVKGAANFQIGVSNPRKDWPAHQEPGHTYKILFSLDSIGGTYSLKIGTLIERPRVPALQVSINGHSGRFYLHPKLSYSRGDFTYAFDPHESQSLVAVDVPPSFLKRGENTIAITPVDDPPTPPGEKEIGGITYDALSLEHDPARKYLPREITVAGFPSIFYRQTSGGLNEIVDVFLGFNGPVHSGGAELTIGGIRYRAPVSSSDWGQQRLRFEIPEWKGTLPAKLAIRAGVRRSFQLQLTPKRKWTIFVVPHTHLDIGYTDYQGKVAETQARVLTQAAALIHQHPDFRFSMDGSWNLQQLLTTRSQPIREQILDLIRSGKMAMPAQYCNLLTGYASLETLYRSLYYSKKLANRYGLPFEYANITDVPTYSGSYPSILASSGIKYWVAASNNDRAPIFFYDHWNEKSPFWWEGPDGNKVLFWYSRHYMQVQTLFGLPPELDAIRESLPIYLQAYAKPSYKPDVALIYGTQVENTDLFPSTATFADIWDRQYAYPKLQYATFPEFFHYIQARYGNDLPVFKGDGGGYWEDGIGSDAYYAAEDRANQHRALSAEILSSATHSLDSSLNPPAGLLDDIWRNIVLFSEHTWTSYNSVSQPDHEEAVKQLRVKDSRADRAALEIDNVMNRSLSQLANEIHVPAQTLVVFNSLNWQRDLMVETDLFEHSGEHPVLVDLTTNQEIPFETIYEKENFLHARFVVPGVPSVGYKCVSIRYAKGAAPRPETPPALVVENRFYRIQVDLASGSVKSIYDKQLGRELVDSSSPYKFGQYLYVTGGDGNTQMINPFPALPPGKLTIHPASQGSLESIEKMPWGTSIRLHSSDVNTPGIQTEILIFNNEKKIEFRYKVHKIYTTKKEGVYFAFPAAISHPEFAYASQQGWIDPARDLMKGGSVEWFNVQDWMALRDANATLAIVPLDASLACFGDINRGVWPGKFKPKSATIFSYVMNNYWHTNYRAGQGGDFEFRYAVTSAPRLDSRSLTRLALEEMRPAELNHVVGQDKPGNPPRPLPPQGAGFLETSGSDVVLSTWKEAEDGKGMVLRFMETAGKRITETVRFDHAIIRAAHLASGVEAPESSLPVEDNSIRLSFKPFEVVTVRVELTPSR